MRIHYTAYKSSTNIPVLLSYKCSFCGTVNTNQTQIISLISSSSVEDFARKMTLKKIQRISDQISEDRYLGEGLSPCKCSNCQKEEAWSKRNHDKSIIIYLALSFIAWYVFGKIISLLSLGESFSIFTVCLSLFAFPVLALIIRKKRTDKKISKMPYDYRPHVVIHDWNSLEKA